MKLYRWFVDLIDGFGITRYVMGLILAYLLFVWAPRHVEESLKVLNMFFALLPLALPFILWDILKHAWRAYSVQKKHASTETCLLEIRLPDDLPQTPYAMELVLSALYQTSGDTPFQKKVRGHTNPTFALELVSIEGAVHFFVWTRRSFKNLVETQFYAHYPSVQVVEVPDYTTRMPLDFEKVKIWAVEQTLQKPDPYPIYTYVEAGLDKWGEKEENKHDPMLSLIEFFGSFKKGQHAWMQIVFRAHNEEFTIPRAHELTHEHLTIKKWAEKEVEEIIKKTAEDEEGKRYNFTRLSEGEKKMIEAIQNKQNKQLFDVNIKMVYITEPDAHDGSKKAGFPSVMRAFEHGSQGRGLNGLKPIFHEFDYWWQDPFGRVRKKTYRELYEAYVLRQAFYPPFMRPYIVLNAEEIASFYHLPGKVAKTPTLQRMLSRRADAPANLPV